MYACVKLSVYVRKFVSSSVCPRFCRYRVRAVHVRASSCFPIPVLSLCLHRFNHQGLVELNSTSTRDCFKNTWTIVFVVLFHPYGSKVRMQYACMIVCLSVCLCVCVCMYLYVLYVFVCVCMYLYMFACVNQILDFVQLYYIYIYICIHNTGGIT